MAIIAALSVQYSKAGINVFHCSFFPISSNARRSLLLADTPPAIQISRIPVCLEALRNLFSRIETILSCTEAQISARFSEMKAELTEVLSCRKYRMDVLRPLK